MYATAAFDFDQFDNGWLMAEFAFMRSFFLIFLFPPIINMGRRWTTTPKPAATVENDAPVENGEVRLIQALPSDDEVLNCDGQLPTSPGEFDVGQQLNEEPVEAVQLENKDDSRVFDLIFLRWSLVVDGALTMVAAFATTRWHIYLGKLTDKACIAILIHIKLILTAAFLLPFGSGSAPAAKGVITEMCTDSQRSDALNAVTLVENIARLSTQGLFGFVFAALAGVGKAYLTFFCNAVSSRSSTGISSPETTKTNRSVGCRCYWHGRAFVFAFPA